MKELKVIAMFLWLALTSVCLVSCGGDDVSDESMNDVEAEREVDLGLSVKWSAWNVGANSPEEYGNYYAWGEIEDKGEYTWVTYKHWIDTSEDGGIHEEEMFIGPNIAGTQYDVASINWGNGWRMPTKAEFDELKQRCYWESFTNFGVKGYKVTGPNGNSIFLPFAGCRVKYSLENVNKYGIYWIGLNDLYPSIGAPSFVLDYDKNVTRYENTKLYVGLSVRPVKDK